MQAKCGSWLACDSITAVQLKDRGACIAGKPAPTLFLGGLEIAQPIDLQSTHNHSLPIAQRSAKMRRLIRT